MGNENVPQQINQISLMQERSCCCCCGYLELAGWQLKVQLYKDRRGKFQCEKDITSHCNSRFVLLVSFSNQLERLNLSVEMVRIVVERFESPALNDNSCFNNKNEKFVHTLQLEIAENQINYNVNFRNKVRFS